MKKLLFVVVILLAFSTDAFARAYLRNCLIGGTSGCIDDLDITAVGDPDANSVNLAEGDSAIVITISGDNVAYYIYVFDASGTDAESSPDIIRPDDYSSAGVWRGIRLPFSIATATELEEAANLGEFFSDIADDDTAGEVRTTIDAQQDLDVPSEAQVEDRASTTEYVLTPQRIGQAIADFLADNGLAVESALTAEPAGEHVGQIVLADNDTWDPAGVSGTTPYWAICTSTGSPGTWVAFLSVAGSLIVSGIDTPTLVASELDDTSDPHTLIEAELKNKILSNSESTGADEWDFPARGEGWSFIFVIEAAQNVTLDPNGSEQWYLNGTQMAAGEAIVNTSPTVGESIACYSTEDAVYCESKYSDFAEESP